MEQEYVYLMWYFEQVLGYCPDDKMWLPTRSAIRYMIDNELPSEEIIKELKRHNSESIHPNDLTKALWNGSLLEKGRFYFHKALQIASPAPVLQKDGTVFYPEDYLEMKIRFTEEDVVNYFLQHISKTEQELCDRKKDLKTVSYLLKRFSLMESVEPVDLLLCLIDDFSNRSENTINDGVIDVLKSLSNVLPWYQSDYKNAAAAGLNKVRWRYGV